MDDTKRVIAPKGFRFATTGAAIKRQGRKDIGLILSDTVAVVAGAFTTNRVKAAPVRLCMQKIKTGKGRAIIVNSGNANACTGKQGMADARKILSLVSKKLGMPASLAYMSSTGVIGTPLPMEKIVPALDSLVEEMGRSSLADVAASIMTTDTFPKMVHKRVKIGNSIGTVSGICKGAGMIAPNMATMLCFLLTDIAVQGKTLDRTVKNSVAKSFNRITIDGDMSTNDTVLMMSNGALGNEPIGPASEYRNAFVDAVEEVLYGLSRLVAKDGEGATKLVEVVVKGAANEAVALRAAMAVANSSLVKTAIYGNDANWGRIMAALGYSGIRFTEEKTDISFGNVKVVKKGLATGRDDEAARVMKSKELRVTIDLHAGSASVNVLTCDLTEDYIRINAEYRT